jgi:AAA-like domain
MTSSLDAVLDFTDKTLYTSTGEHLNDLQRLILQELWLDAKQTYRQIAIAHNYSGNYIQQIAAPRLWHLLSEVLGQKVTKFNVCDLLAQQLTQAKVSQAKVSQAKVVCPTVATLPEIEYPAGSVPLGSAFYLPRLPQEDWCYQTILQPNALIQIKAPRQMGKTSLMNRIVAHAKANDCQAVSFNLQLVGQPILENLDSLLRWFCHYLVQKLKLSVPLASCWHPDMGCKTSCTLYIESILEALSTPLVLAIDEVSELFQYPMVAQEFLSLLRTWHEYSKTDATWQKLRLVLVQSTEAYLPIVNPQTWVDLGLNVGLSVTLVPFTRVQIETLSRQQGVNLSDSEHHQLFELTQGHPYLTRLMLYHLAAFQADFDHLVAIATTNTGIYHEHLRHYQWLLQAHPELLVSLQQLTASVDPVVLESTQAFKLQSLGLVKLCGRGATIACELYRHYFGQ